MKITIFFLLLALMPLVAGMQMTQECVNTTHLETIIKWSECDDGTCTDNNITQMVGCIDNCDEARDECFYSNKQTSASGGILLALCGGSGLFCFLGLKASNEHEALRMLFTMMGLWLLLTTLGVADSMALGAGLSRPTITAIETGIQVASWTVYIFMAYFMMMFLYSHLMRLAKSGNRLKKRK